MAAVAVADFRLALVMGLVAVAGLETVPVVLVLVPEKAG
jgi:hypothetical protein